MKKLFYYKFKNRWVNWGLLVILPILTLCAMEFYTHVPWDLSVPIFILNLVFYYLLYGLCSFLLGSTGRGYVLATILPMLFGLINYFVVDFRSSPIVPWDIYSIRTAASVAGNYEFNLKIRLVWVLLGFLVILILGSKTNVKAGRMKIRFAGLFLSVLCLFGYVKEIGADRTVKAFGLDTTLFTPNVLYRNNGLMGGFLSILKYMKVETPRGYSPEKANEILEEYREETGEEASVDLEELPNVIVIMNEAFSDPSVFGEFDTDYDYMPFIHSLKENTVKGNCYVSVKGGNTANTEYEFLTGDSMAFMPAGSVPYQQYIKGEMPSIASYLGNLGYETNAIHPYYGTGWARDKVYPWFGFDTMTFKDDFVNPRKIRNYISDSSAFDKIIEQYEKKEQGSRMFTFEVTMQNHGGYSKDVEGFEETVHLTQLSNKTTSVRAAEKYLTLMLETDRAFEALVNYFDNQEEDTIILMFGDHQPSDYITNTILNLLGLDRETSEDVYFENYSVPFVMWANFELQEEVIQSTSVNYLGGLLFEKGGIPLTPYQEFLKEMRQEIPAITANMLLTKDGERQRLDEAEYPPILEEYHNLVYNHLCDGKNILEGVYDQPAFQ